MPKLTPISAKKLIKILGRLGFEKMRSRGSHHFFQHHSSKLTATIPMHGNEDVSIGTLRAILNDIEISVSEYEKMRTEK